MSALTTLAAEAEGLAEELLMPLANKDIFEVKGDGCVRWPDVKLPWLVETYWHIDMSCNTGLLLFIKLLHRVKLPCMSLLGLCKMSQGTQIETQSHQKAFSKIGKRTRTFPPRWNLLTPLRLLLSVGPVSFQKLKTSLANEIFACTFFVHATFSGLTSWRNLTKSLDQGFV